MATSVITNRKSRTWWAKTINHTWGASLKAATLAVHAGVKTGQYLIEAKAQLGHGEFEAMVRSDLAFSERKASDLMNIARSPQITKAHHGALLPTGWTILRAIAALDEDDFKWAVEAGLISKDMTRGAAIAIKHARKTTKKVIDVSKGERGPTPKEARKIAAATGRLIVASDGKMYTGTTEEEDADYNRRLYTVSDIREAVEKIAAVSVSPQEWVAMAEDHWIFEFEPDKIDEAVSWLVELKPLLVKHLVGVKREVAKRRLKVVRNA